MKRKHATKSKQKTKNDTNTEVNGSRIYTYQHLKDLAKKEADRINIYAAVLDCSGVYYMKSIEKYVCTLKLIDETLNPGIHTPDPSRFMNVTMFSRTSSRLPQKATIGSVLRIHRGQTKKNKGECQLNCDVDIKGAWALFDSESNVNPISESGRTHTFVPKDKIRLKDIRKFAKKYFQTHNSESIPLDVALKERLEEFDSICYVLDIKKKGKLTRILLCDKTKLTKLYIPSNQTLSFTPSSVIRLRSAGYCKRKDKLCLELNDYSNIITIPAKHKTSVEMIESIKSEEVSNEVLEELKIYNHDLSTVDISHPTIKKNKLVCLKDLYSGNLPKLKENSFHVRVNVMEVGPKKPLDWIRMVDKNKNHYSFKEMKEKRVGLEYYLKLQLFVKDASGTTDNNLYTFFLCTVDGKGKEFIKLPQGNKKPDDKYLEKLRRIYKTLTRPWSILDCIIEYGHTEDQPIFFVTNTRLDLD